MSHKTARYLCHRIRAAMASAEKPMLNRSGGMDEAYLGAKRRGVGGQWRDLKEVVIGITQRNGDLRFFRAEEAKRGTPAKYIKENISQDVEVIMTDELRAYPGAIQMARIQQSIFRPTLKK